MDEGGSNEGEQGPWTCVACTFDNENDRGLACAMCGTERQTASPAIPRNRDGDASSSSAAVLNAAPDGGDSNGESTAPPVAKGGDGSLSQSHCCDKMSADASTARPPRGDADIQPKGGSSPAALGKNQQGSKAAGGGSGRWDAFASLENNLESSDDGSSSGEGSGGGSENDEEDRKMGTDGAGDGGWDAFKSLEQNYESSEEEYDSSSEEEAEFSDGDNEETGGDDHPSHDSLEGKQPPMKRKPSPECVDLMDSDEEDSNSELEVVEMPGKENNKDDKRRSSRKRSGTKYEPYEIDGGSDSELSEVESSRPLPSPSARPMPPWQRRKSTPGSIGKTGNLKGRDSFACLSSRSDVLGGAGAGMNGFRWAKRKGEDAEGATTKRKSRKASESASASKGTNKSKASASASAAKAKTTRTRKRNTAKAASKAPAKRRRKRSYRRSNTRAGSGRGRGRGNATTGGRANGNNAWSARERGIRQRRGGGESAPYMNIAKQEPMLRNVGGASIQF